MTSREKVLLSTLAAGLLGLGLARVPTTGGGREGAVDNRQLLVTSSIGATSSILFVLDPATCNLAAYEALPGENGGLRLLGARKIEHDLELKKYRDLSEYSFDDLKARKQEGAAPKTPNEKAAGSGEQH
jgi:hypothetical protein